MGFLPYRNLFLFLLKFYFVLFSNIEETKWNIQCYKISHSCHLNLWVFHNKSINAIEVFIVKFLFKFKRNNIITFLEKTKKQKNLPFPNKSKSSRSIYRFSLKMQQENKVAYIIYSIANYLLQDTGYFLAQRIHVLFKELSEIIILEWAELSVPVDSLMGFRISETENPFILFSLWYTSILLKCIHSFLNSKLEQMF